MAKWATDTPPKKSGLYLVTYCNAVRIAKRYEYPPGCWHWSVLPSCSTVSDCEVKAWQKCPAPYVAK